MSAVRAAAVVGFLITMTAAAEEPAWRVPADWDVEARLTMRFDAVRNADRRRVYATDHAAALVQADATDIANVREFIVDGSRNPELFLPHELFDGLMTAFVDDEVQRFRQRDAYDPGIRALGLDEQQFWTELALVSSSYREIRLVPASTADARCRARFEALGAARAHFGRRAFDRLLYRVVASTHQNSFATNDPDPAASLRREDRGCR